MDKQVVEVHEQVVVEKTVLREVPVTTTTERVRNVEVIQQVHARKRESGRVRDSVEPDSFLQ